MSEHDIWERYKDSSKYSVDWKAIEEDGLTGDPDTALMLGYIELIDRRSRVETALSKSEKICKQEFVNGFDLQLVQIGDSRLVLRVRHEDEDPLSAPAEFELDFQNTDQFYECVKLTALGEEGGQESLEMTIQILIEEMPD